MALQGLHVCKNRACSVSEPEIVEGNQTWIYVIFVSSYGTETVQPLSRTLASSA